ncbi:MAG: DUF1588 domain-containing protein, partial [Deltaproteobacteria bacterium]
PAIKAAMLTETQLFLEDYLLGDEPISGLLTARTTYVNDTLAAYYGLPAPGSAQFARVALPDNSKRIGLLGQGSVLIAGAHANVTSPVLRGRMVLEQLLCAPILGPPATVNTLLPTAAAGTTLRQQLEAHVTNPACASCHTLMDPIGYALEAFDGAGHARTTDNGQPIDTSGTLVGGGSFADAIGMAQLVASDPRLEPCAERMMLTYALGRVMQDSDAALLASVQSTVAAHHHSFADLIHAITAAPAFTQRRAPGS